MLDISAGSIVFTGSSSICNKYISLPVFLAILDATFAAHFASFEKSIGTNIRFIT
jgi:hypothetical protein